MVHGYHGRAHVRMGASSVPVDALIMIDDPGRADWNATVDPGTDASVFAAGGPVQVVLLEGPDQGHSADADLRVSLAGEPTLRGRSTFGGPPQPAPDGPAHHDVLGGPTPP